MELKYSIKHAAVFFGVLALVSITAGAQENRSEISIPGTGFFTKDTAGNGTFERANETGGFLVGYRYNFNCWLGAEANYGYDRNTQFYFGGTPAGVQSDIHQLTGAAVVKLPTFLRLQPYALAGAETLVFDPTGNFGGSFAGATTETRATFVYGVGAHCRRFSESCIRSQAQSLSRALARTRSAATRQPLRRPIRQVCQALRTRYPRDVLGRY